MVTLKLGSNGQTAKFTEVPAFGHHSCLSVFNEAPEVCYRRGDLVFDARQQSQYLFLVTSGIVKVVSFYQQNEMLYDYYLPNQIVNAEAVFSSSTKDLLATASTHLTKVKRLSIDNFQKALESQPSLHQDLASHLMQSLLRTQERLLRLTLLSAEQRVVHFLLAHNEKAGRRVGFEYVIKPLPTHQEIGHFAGTGRQTVTTVLNDLRRQDIVHFNRHYLIIRNLDALKAKLAE